MESEAVFDVPTTRPFGNLDQLYSSLENLKPWPSIVNLRENAEYVYQGSEVDIQKKKLSKVDRDDQPKTLICHDMKGGYLADRFIHGSDAHDSYTFYHWSVVDTFVYFSHHFITIPPYGWINAAHNHGVKILGTVITEHTDGAQICHTFLQSRESVEKFANALVTIAKFYNFEGWLLNIENTIESKDVDNLMYFVKYLTERIHQEIEASEIIWYDSVTNKGTLHWQNELNNHNKEFFLNCDGIFLNYNWTDSGLASSYIVAKTEGRNVRNVYVGLDVWGRGCPGGGGFNSAHALEKIRQQGLSVAFFAPGWTHEYFGARTFLELENIFWAQLFPYLYIHVPIYDNEMFKTSFCLGAGLSYFRCGKVQLEMQVSRGKSFFKEKSFYNLALQKPQISVPVPHLKFTRFTEPTKQNDKTDALPNKLDTKEPKECVYETSRNVIRIRGNHVDFLPKDSTLEVNRFEFCQAFSFEGGTCLKLITRDTDLYHRLFLVHVEFDHEIQVTIIYTEAQTIVSHYGVSLDPILMLGNDTGLKSIAPSESSIINNNWRKCIYWPGMRTVNEIGISFAAACDIYLGQIVLESRQHRHDRLEEADCALGIGEVSLN